MPWMVSNATTQQDLERMFALHGINFGAPGFFDEPGFLVQERRDPRYLEHYACYVEAKTYDEEYLEAARRRIDIAAEALRAAIEKDCRLGACVDASCMLGRILDRLGVWNYVAKTTLTINFPRGAGLTPRYFWAFDEGQFVAPHAIVVAPPYYVVDVTVRYQPYNARQAQHLPSRVLADAFTAADWRPEDLANHGLLAALHHDRITFKQYLQHRNPAMAQVMSALPPRKFTFNETSLKYVIVAVGGFIEPLEELKGYKPCGRTAMEIFQQDIQPQVT